MNNVKSDSRSAVNAFLIFSCLVFSSCKKFVEVAPPSTQIETSKIFTSDGTALSTMNGLYSMIGLANLNFINGGVTLYAGLSADEIYPTATNADADPFVTNSVSPNHTNLFNRLWRGAYNNNYLYTANAVIEGLNGSTALTDSLRIQLLGEAKVIRALGYFYLVNMFSDVPLVLNTDFATNASLPRATAKDIYSQIVKDLVEATGMLKVSYPLSARTRLNKTAATALLARVFLYTEDWVNAEKYASEVIGSGMYSLNSSLSNIFNSISSTETIWQLARDNNVTPDGATFIPSSATARPTYAITSQLMNAFSTNDPRRSSWTGRNVVNNVEYYYPYKYKYRLATQGTEYYIILRLAEQFLIRAEARARQGNIVGGLEDLNRIRLRAGVGVLNGLNQTDLLQAIYKERQVELFCEMGHRWFDLKRSGAADGVLKPLKGSNWQSTDVFYPIPQNEIDRNPFLTQNPGY